MPSALHVPRTAHQVTRHTLARAFLYTSVFVACQSDHKSPRYRPGKPPVLIAFSHFSRISRLDFNMQTLWRKFALFQLVPRAHHAPQRPRFSAWRCLNSSSTNCANFTQLLATVWAARNRKWRNVGTMATDRQTNLQTDAPSLNSYLDFVLGSRYNPNLTTGCKCAQRQRQQRHSQFCFP